MSRLAGVATLYLTDKLSWWLTVPLLAVPPLSILHELEHDLIHDQYFRRQRRLQDVLFLVIWLSKLSLNPWYRRRIHLRHHRFSGQKIDIEERLIGLGLPFGCACLSLPPFGSLLLLDQLRARMPRLSATASVFLSLPVYLPLLLLTYAGFGYLARPCLFGDPCTTCLPGVGRSPGICACSCCCRIPSGSSASF